MSVDDVKKINAKRGIGLNKLRAYKLFKTEYKVEEYVLKVKAVSQQSAISRFRCGWAPLNLEIGRFFNIPANERFCNFCPDQVEDESHVILICPLYNKIREELFIHASYINDDFMQMNGTEKVVFLFSDSKITQRCAKTCNTILKIRKSVTETFFKCDRSLLVNG